MKQSQKLGGDLPLYTSSCETESKVKGDLPLFKSSCEVKIISTFYEQFCTGEI